MSICVNRLAIRSAIQFLQHHLVSTSSTGSLVQGLDVVLPLLHIRSEHSAIISVETVDLAFNVRGLRVDGPAASESLDLLAKLTEENASAVVVGFEVSVDLVRLVDGVDGLLNVPEALEREIEVSKGSFWPRIVNTWSTHFSMEILWPMPPNSPWMPMRVGS